MYEVNEKNALKKPYDPDMTDAVAIWISNSLHKLANIVKKPFFYVLLFFFMFNTNFVFFPFSSRIMIAAAGAVLFVFTFWKNRNIEIMLKPAIFFLIVVLLGLCSTVVQQELDFSFFKEEIVVLMVIPLFGAYLVSYVGRRINVSMAQVLKGYIFINSLQSVIIIWGLLQPSFKDKLIGIQKWNDRTEFIMRYGGRMCGLGARFDYGSMLISLSLICIVFLYFIQAKKEPVKFVLLYTVQTIAGALLARSVIFGVLCSSILFLILDSRRKKKLKILGVIGALIGLAVLFVVIFYSQLQPLLEKYENTFRWMFEMFLSDKSGTNEKANSLTVLSQKMYYLPEHFSTWIIGDGRFSTKLGNPYGSTDPLYMRYLLFFGIPGISAFLIFYKSIFDAIGRLSRKCIYVDMSEKRNTKKFFYVVLAFTLLMYFKSNTHCFYFLFYFLFYYFFRTSSSKPCIEGLKTTKSFQSLFG